MSSNVRVSGEFNNTESFDEFILTLVLGTNGSGGQDSFTGPAFLKHHQRLVKVRTFQDWGGGQSGPWAVEHVDTAITNYTATISMFTISSVPSHHQVNTAN